MAENEANQQQGLTVYVDDQPVTVEEKELTIRRLLELAGSPTEGGSDGEAVLRELRGGQEIEHNDLNTKIRVEEETRFYTRNVPTETGGEKGSFGSESSNVETGTTPKANVNTSSFGGGKGASSMGTGGSTPNKSEEQRQGFNAGGQKGTGTGVGTTGGKFPTPET